MAELRNRLEPSITSLLESVIADVKKLIRQQIAMFSSECRSDWERSKQAATMFGLAAGPLAVGGILLGFMLVHLLHWAASPQNPVSSGLPLWACFGIVGLASTLLGLVLLAVAARRFRGFTPLPNESVEALQENFRWLTNQN